MYSIATKIGNGRCDGDVNNKECGYDGWECCSGIDKTCYYCDNENVFHSPFNEKGPCACHEDGKDKCFIGW